MDSEKYPYHFSNEQIDQIGLIVGNASHANESVLQKVTHEIGIAKTREILSNVQKRVTIALGLGEGQTALMLTDTEVLAMLSLPLPEDLKGILRDEL